MIDMKQKKKDMLVEFLKLGMDFDSACLAAEIDDDFKKELQYDDAFTHLANTAIAKKEVELLQKLEAIGEANAVSLNRLNVSSNFLIQNVTVRLLNFLTV